MSPSPNLRQALQQARQLGLERLDAQCLLLLALGRRPEQRAWLCAHDEQVLTEDAAARWALLLQRRLQGEPLAYLSGEKEFFGLPLRVDARVLVPRPETETLVQWAIERLDAQAQSAPQVLDLGTGSGAIALAIKSQRPAARVRASDASAQALALARANAQRLGLAVEFHLGHWLAPFGSGADFDLIVSNPPYIAEGDPHLPALRHEPLGALCAGPDGLDELRAIITAAPLALRPGGWLLLEHGHDQAAAVRALLRTAGFALPSSRCDLAGIERCSGGQWPQA